MNKSIVFTWGPNTKKIPIHALLHMASWHPESKLREELSFKPRTAKKPQTHKIIIKQRSDRRLKPSPDQSPHKHKISRSAATHSIYN